MVRTSIAAIARCRRGTTALEFALLLPVFASIVVGTLYTALAVYSAVGLHSAVEQAARCYSVNAITCASATTTQTYAQTQYHGIGTPAFAASTPACGHQVSATVSVTLNAVSSSFTIPLNATACFP